MSSTPVDPNLGRTFLGYELEGVLGRGGMGVVYRAYDPTLDRWVALKVIAPELAADPGFRDRFLAESRAAARLDHPNVLPVYAAGEAEGHMFLVTKLVEGGSLAARLPPGGMVAAEAIAVLEPLADALDAAHAAGLVHRDVKPSNVLVDANGHVYLGDFGLARSVSDPAPAGFGTSLGTVDYVAPEQIAGDAVAGAADVYSLACLLHQCLTGTPPFAGQTEAAVLFAHLQSPPPHAERAGAAITHGMAKDAGDRPASCTALVAEATHELRLGRSRGRGVALVAIAVAVLAVVAGIAVMSSRGRADAAGGRLVSIDTRTGAVTSAYHLGDGAQAVDASPSRVWVVTARDASLWEVSPRTHSVHRSPTGPQPLDVAARGNQAFVVTYSNGSGRLEEYRTATGQTNATGVNGGASLVRNGGDRIWVISPDHLYRLRIGSYFLKPDVWATIPARETEAEARLDVSGAAVEHHHIWIAGDATDPRVWELDLAHRNRLLHSVTLPTAPLAVAAGAGSVWVSGQMSDRVYRLDPGTGAIQAVIRVGREPSGLAAGGGGVWVANTIDRTVQMIDPRTNRVTRTIDVPEDPWKIALAKGTLWVAGDAS